MLTPARVSLSGIERSLPHLRISAERVATDLRFALGDGWSCVVDDAFVLRVSGPSVTDQVALATHVTDLDEPDPTWSKAQLSSVLEEDADEAIAGEALEVLRAVGVTGPRCEEHGEPLGSCLSVWICPVGHDGPFVGDLGRSNPTSATP